MQAPRTSAPARTLCRIVASCALLSMLMACGYKGPLYMPPPPAPDASLTTPPESSNLSTQPAPAGTAATPGTVPAK